MRKLVLSLLLALATLATPALAQTGTQTISTAGSDCSTTTNCAIFGVRGYPSIGVYLNVGTSGTFVFEATTSPDPYDADTIWFGINDDVGDSGSVTADGQIFFSNPGYSYIRIRASAISGDATVIAFPGFASLKSTATLSGASQGDGAIQDGSNNTIEASVLDLTNSNPLTVAITDSNGDQVTSFGGGTQYTNGAVQATPTGTVSFGFDGTNVRALNVDATGNLVLAAGNNNIGNFDLASAIPSGDNNIGNVDIASTVLPSNATTGNGVTGAGVQRVNEATDSDLTLAASSIQSNTAASANALNDLVTNIAEDAAQGNAVAATGPQIMGEAKNFDGAALPNAVLEGQATRPALTLNGVAYATLVSADGSTAMGSATNPLLVLNAAYQFGGCSPTKYISAATTNATSVKASGGQIYTLQVINLNAATRYLKLYDKASAPTVGTDVPVQTLPIPPNGTTGGGFVLPIPTGMAFTNGIAFALTTGVADSDTGAVAANEIIVNVCSK